MPKPRHDNPIAERLIVAYALPRWRSQRELSAEAAEAAKAAERLEALRAVDWESLSPAELAFRWVLQASDTSGESRGVFARWAAAVRDGSAVLKQAPSSAANDVAQAADDWRHMTAAERAYAIWAENKR